MKHNEENSNAPERASVQMSKNEEKDFQQSKRRLMHSEALAEMNKDLGIVNPSTNLEKKLEMEERNGNAISISFIKRKI